MLISERSLPKTTSAECGADYEEGTVRFLSREEGIGRELARFPAGKLLFVTDGEQIGWFSAVKTSPRALSVVLDGADCLPLFSMPEGVVCVFAAGGKEVLLASRYFAEVRRIPCVLFPSEATLSGALCARGEVIVGGARLDVPLRDGSVICDGAVLEKSLPEGVARLLLCRLAKFEQRALAAFSGERLPHADAEELPGFFGKEDKERIVRENAAAERTAPAGEGETLAALLREDGESFPLRKAYRQLVALYAAFFEKGKPRRYFTPDYRARALCAGMEEVLSVPTAEEYARRAMVLERIRAPFAREICELLGRREKEFENFASPPLSDGRSRLFRLKYLPEYTGGLSAVIRDFGLIEWEF